MIRMLYNVVLVALLIALVVPVLFSERNLAWAKCEDEEATLFEMKKHTQNILRSRIYFGQSAQGIAYWVNSKLSRNAGADKAVMYEMGGKTHAVSVVFFKNNCRVTEVKIPVHVYRFILYLRGEYPGAQIL